MYSTSILESLSQSGFRMSRVRKNLIEYLALCQKPHSVPELLNIFKTDLPTLNKTSLYRELSFLKDRGIVQEIELGEGKKRYEISDYHHHHIICSNCEKIEDVAFDQDLSRHESRIEKEMNFKIQSHSLEFFGLCKNCQNL